MDNMFPRTRIANVDISRLVIGCNWISGFSHRSPSQDCAIKHKHSDPHSVAEISATFMEHGVDACVGLFSVDSNLYPAVQEAEQITGRK